MVVTYTGGHPLDPSTSKGGNYYNNQQKGTQKYNPDDLDMSLGSNVAPSSQDMCAELAHQHAMEDLHYLTEHCSEEQSTVKARNSVDQGTQCDRIPDE